MTNDIYTIYKHQNLINHKVYIGVTKQKPESRWQNGKGYLTCSHFYNAIQKYGWDNFSHSIIETVTNKDEAGEREKYWISYYNSTDPNYGYNLENGGYKGQSFSPETRQKMSLARRGKNNPRYGKPVSQETRNKISQANKGKLAGEKNPMYGKCHSPEAIEKIRQAASCEHPSRWRKVRCITTGQIFDSIKAATAFYHMKSGSHIIQVCKGERNSCGKDPITEEPLRWEYVKEREENAES